MLTVLIGVFGTILGFYFGTTGNAQKIDVAEIRIIDNAVPVSLMTHVTGGTPPYRYSITFSDKNFPAVSDQLSKDGWIIQELKTIPTTGSITVDVPIAEILRAPGCEGYLLRPQLRLRSRQRLAQQRNLLRNNEKEKGVGVE